MTKDYNGNTGGTKIGKNRAQKANLLRKRADSAMITSMATLRFLGTGTSDGVPLLGCSCPVCTSKDPYDTRLRSSVLLKSRAGILLIDAGTDFRHQALMYGITRLDAILQTHADRDHVEGITDLRPLTHEKAIPLFANGPTLKNIRKRFSYIFSRKAKGGGVPRLTLHKVKKPFQLFGNHIIPLPVMHGKQKILGFRLGELSYITDASAIPEDTLKLLRGSRILIINALRKRPHPTHFSVQEAEALIRDIQPEQAFLTHISHKLSHKQLHEMTAVGTEAARDGLEIPFVW